MPRKDIETKFFTAQFDTISGQTKGCYLTIQFRYTRLLLLRFWNRVSDDQGTQITLFGPTNLGGEGYKCKRFQFLGYRMN